jgi:formyl-CoA transferase
VPSKIKELQLDYDSLSNVNPQLIYGSVGGFPSDSVWESKAAFDLTIQALSGLMFINGDQDGPPFKIGYAIADTLTA